MQEQGTNRGPITPVPRIISASAVEPCSRSNNNLEQKLRITETKFSFFFGVFLFRWMQRRLQTPGLL
jgi:hypothetical protein